MADFEDVHPDEIFNLVGVSDAITLREAVRHVLNQDPMLADMATILRDGKMRPSVLNKSDIDRLALRPDFGVARATTTIPVSGLNSSNDE